jgi:hypothetical protein
MDMRFCTRKYRSPYRTGSLTAAARELSRYKLDLLGMQEVRWDFGVTVRKGDYSRRGNDDYQLGTEFFYDTE